jgi:opacity protein-like surface antigen
MHSGFSAVTAILAISVISCNALADELGEPIDLSGMSEIRSSLETTADAPNSEAATVAFDPASRGHRFYLTGIVGGSFATLTNSQNPHSEPNRLAYETPADTTGALFNGGGAIGVAFARSSGQLRMEIEQRLRGPMDGQVVSGSSGSPSATAYTDNAWSTTMNLWRDFFMTDQLGFYVGGGLGMGGYRSTFFTPPDEYGLFYGSESVATWAWQAGTGVTYALSDRITLDVGYRFFATAPAAINVSQWNGAGYYPYSYSSSLTASELLLSIRIYEPFRNWR